MCLTKLRRTIQTTYLFDMTRTQQYTEWIGNTPIDVEVYNEGLPDCKTLVNIRGKVWEFSGVETAASAYDKINAVMNDVNDIFSRHKARK